jgi:hypothetical protein
VAKASVPVFFSSLLVDSTTLLAIDILVWYGSILNELQEELDEHRQGKREGKQKDKSDKRITAKGSTTLCANLAY